MLSEVGEKLIKAIVERYPRLLKRLSEKAMVREAIGDRENERS